jgi:hypothetical protein
VDRLGNFTIIVSLFEVTATGTRTQIVLSAIFHDICRHLSKEILLFSEEKSLSSVIVLIVRKEISNILLINRVSYLKVISYNNRCPL